MITCPICKTVHNPNQLKRLEADCRYIQIAGVNQHLVRHQCNVCDVIFGSQEMLNLPNNRLIQAYLDAYNSGCREHDNTHYELQLLQMLSPTSTGTYINWGAGTSNTVELAQQNKINLLNYDPPMPYKYNYVSREQLSNMQVDGIISNNVLDHLQDPISELLFMKSILKPGGTMIHASDGFRYDIAYTKFHLFFFVGKSLDYIDQVIDLKHTIKPGSIDGSDVVRWNKSN